MESVEHQITQLELARQVVLQDSVHYSTITPGILPIIGANAPLEIRRWGADFLAEGFASPSLSAQAKEALGVQTLHTFNELLDSTGEDSAVVKSVIQAAASIYGLVFRHSINNPQDGLTWGRMTTLKSKILKRWDASTTGVRVCCIKFVQRAVQVQTPGTIMDPAHPEQSEVSLALVPPSHPFLSLSNLEAEASGLLDRLLNVFQEATSNAVLVDATLNCLMVLVRTRPSIANKIVSAILNFNPFKSASPPFTAKAKILLKSMERTIRAFLLNILRRNENGPFAPRIKQYIDRLAQARIELLDEGSRKRAAPAEEDGQDTAKRIRLDQGIIPRLPPPPLPPGPVSYAQSITLTDDEGLAGFDVKTLPEDIIMKILVPILRSIQPQALDYASNCIHSRFTALHQQNLAAEPTPSSIPSVPALDNDDEDEDYEPFEPLEPTEEIDADLLPIDAVKESVDLAIGPFKLPQPPPLTPDEAREVGKSSLSRIFGVLPALDEPHPGTRKLGLNRLAASTYDRDAWLTIIMRLATRASAGLAASATFDTPSADLEAAVVAKAGTHGLSNSIREQLCRYVIEDFRTRLPRAISWLNEEWYNDRMQAQALLLGGEVKDGEVQSENALQPNYEKWVLRVLDGIVPYLDAKDKVLIRFLSEIPVVSKEVLERVKGLARDPDRVSLAVQGIFYLVLLKPPVRELALDALEDLYRASDEAKAPIKKLAGKLAGFRPGAFQDAAKPPLLVHPTKTELPLIRKASPPRSATGTPVQPSEQQADAASMKTD